jgi:hypothetical protein
MLAESLESARNLFEKYRMKNISGSAEQPMTDFLASLWPSARISIKKRTQPHPVVAALPVGKICSFLTGL